MSVIHRVLLKAKYSFYSALVFFLFVNPETWQILDRVIGSIIPITTSAGAPTMGGMLVTTTLFFFTMWGLMLIPTS